MTTEGDSVVVGDTGNFALRSVRMQTGTTTTLAGGTRGFEDGVGVNAKFEDVKGVFGSGDGKIYVLDRERLRVVDVASREVTTLAGVKDERTPIDGPFAAARFGYFVAGAYDRAAQAIYVTEGPDGSTFDAAFPVIRRIDLVAKTVTTVVGTRGQIGLAPLALPTTLGCPSGLAVAANGDVFFADYCDSVVAVLKSL